MVTIRASATSVNLGSGFDVFGVVLDHPAGIVHVEWADRTTTEVTGVGSRYIPTGPDWNVVDAIAEALDAPTHIRIDKGVRPSSDLGSSAASPAAAAIALSEPYDRGLSREELVPVAAKGEAVVSGEAHAGDVTPALLDGFTVAIDEGVTAVDADIPLIAYLLEIVVSTRDVRRVAPSDASIEDMTHMVGRAATLAVGMCHRDANFVGAGMNNCAVMPAWAKLISGYHDIHEAVLTVGATGVTVSGVGPSVPGVHQAASRTRVADVMLKAFDEADAAVRAYKTWVGRGAEVFKS